MNLKVNFISDRGTPDKERLVLKVLRATDIGEYAVFRAGYEEGNVTTAVTNTFWFPDKSVEAGDLVVLYSKAGVESEKPLKNGKNAHFFYWGADRPLWELDDFAAVVLHISKWISHIPSEQ